MKTGAVDDDDVPAAVRLDLPLLAMQPHRPLTTSP
jgi:hypothetical protein